MGVPDDANPLNRRLPAEVISRRHKPEKKKQQEEEAPLETDRGQVLALKPEHRVKWLGKALLKGQEGKVSMTLLYDIIAHTKFSMGASENVGRKMNKIVRANLSHFSQKQQRYLEGESKLAKDFRYKGVVAEDIEFRPEATAATSSANAPEEADADAGGLSADEIPALWDRLTTLAAAQCEEAVATLDPVTKSRLEDFLEARMLAKTSAAAASASAPARSKSRGRSSSKSNRSRSRSRSSARKRDPKDKKPKRNHSSSKSSSKHSSSSSSSRHQRRRSRSRRRDKSKSKSKSRRDKR